MGLAAAFLFIGAVKRDWFRNLEDAKYQVFWSDLEEMAEREEAQEKANGSEPEKK